MGIQRQVIGKQVDIVAQQGLQALFFHAADSLIFPFPEIAMMDQDRIRILDNSGINQGLAGRHATDHSPYLLAPFHLKPVGAVILKAVRGQFLVEHGQHVIALEHDTYRKRSTFLTLEPPLSPERR